MIKTNFYQTIAIKFELYSIPELLIEATLFILLQLFWLGLLLVEIETNILTKRNIASNLMSILFLKINVSLGSIFFEIMLPREGFFFI